MADLNDQAEELARILEQVNEEMRRFGRISDETAEALKAGGAKREKELKAAASLTVQSLTSLAGAASASGRAMLEGQKGATAFNSALDEMTTAAYAAGAALTFLLPFGPVAKALIAGTTAAVGALSKYTKAANEMADRLYKGYSGLAKAGAAASDGMTGLFEDAKKLGLSMNELGDLAGIIGANSKDMALFGQGVFTARRQLANMGKSLESNREEFIRLGMNMQDVTESMIGYVKTQRIQSAINARAVDMSADSIRRYIVEQDALTKLTGMSVKEQEQAQEAIRSQERFAAKLEELRQRGLGERARELEKTYLILSSQNKEAAQGFADISTNNVQTEAAQKSLMGTQGESMRVAQRISAGQIEAAEAAQRVARAHGQTATQLGTTMGQIGTYNETFGDLAGDLRLRGLAEQDIQKVLAKIEEDRSRLNDKEGKSGDELLTKQGRLINTQIKANEAMERFVRAGIGPAQTAMIKLAEATTGGADALNKLFGITPGPAKVEGTRGGERAQQRQEQQRREEAAQQAAPVRSRGGAQRRAAEQQRQRQDEELQKAQPSARGGRGATIAPGSATLVPPAPTSQAPAGPGPGTAPDPYEYVQFTGGTGSQEHFEKLAVPVQKAFLAMARDYNNLTGKKLQVNSAFRSPEEQAKVDPGVNPKAAPGMSLHQLGRAIDIQSEQAAQLERLGLLANYRFKSGAAFNDPPHIYMADGGVIPATPGGVSVTAGEAGKNEAFVPLPDGKTIPVSIQGMKTENLVSVISELTAKLKILKGDDLIDVAQNRSQSFQQEMARMADTVATATREATKRGVDVAQATQVRPLEELQDIAKRMLANGGITQGPSIAGEAGPEAVVPLPDGKTIPVSINLRDVAQTGPTAFGYNEWKGYNQGPMTTDLEALKQIAGQLGAYDAATQTITDPNTWKEILKSGMLMNYDLGPATIGTKMAGPEIGIEIGDRIKEVMVEKNADLKTALDTVKQEFSSAMKQVIEKMQTVQDPALQLQVLSTLQEISRSQGRTADASQRLAQVAMN